VVFYDDKDSCQWLRDTHLRSVQGVPLFQSFTLNGNEDCPHRIALYSSAEPLFYTAPIAEYELDDSGEYVRKNDAK
jgi:hypothetical protein